jgi:phage N-6-adenine-methyltransferase
VTDSYMAAATSSASPEWPTPRWLVDQLAAEFGPFDLDPSATADNAKAPVFYTMADDGLSQPWAGRVWLNPPYGRTIGQWMRKARTATTQGHADIVVCLVPARVDSRWWRDAAAAASLVRIWPGRIAFADGTQPAPFPSAVIVFGKLPGRHGSTPAWCQAPGCGRVYWPARSDVRTCSDACRQALCRSRLTGRKRDRRRAVKRDIRRAA